MLGKLLKYEFRATGRIFLPFFGALLVVSTISRIIGSFSRGGAHGIAEISGAPYVIGIVISIMLIVAVFVIAFVLMIQRFSKNLVGDEGYLMFTLPVRVDSLIFSKLIVSAAWFILSFIVVLISIAIMSLVNIRQISSVLSDILGQIFTGGIGDVITCVQVVIMIVVSLFTSALSFYMCISLSMLFNRRRGLISFGLYMLFCIVLQILTTIGIDFMRTDLASRLFGWVGNMSTSAAANMTMLGTNLITIIGGGIMYFVTRYMLRRRLNLE